MKTSETGNMQGNIKQFLTESEVNERYGVGIRQLRTMRTRGSGPKYVKVSGTLGTSGGRVLYAVAEVEKWLALLPSGGGNAGSA